MKGPIIGYGKKKGLHSKIVEWTPQQVAEAYRFARGRLLYDPLTEPCPPTPRADAFAHRPGPAARSAPQPMDRRATAEVREDLVRGGDRRGASQEGSVVKTNPARLAALGGSGYV